ncbi:SGNH hydrolase domain-containing protein [Mycolicibacterium tusciae]|uniref:SGNH hydrolase domain-containing protein n=1 Tax=Mycolicibacterium tusciae TaxID=75922 RepID=UPI00024A4406
MVPSPWQNQLTLVPCSWQATDVFFVISGFLITGLLWREVSTAGTIRLRRFYGARARRLLPASATVGVIIAISAALLLPPLQSRPVFLDAIASALYVSNCWFFVQATDYFSDAAASPFLHYWSLGVEEQVYLLWPVIILGAGWVIRRVLRRDGAKATLSKTPYVSILLLVVAASFAASLVLTTAWPPAAFYLMPTRAWELAVGGLLALTVGQWRRLPSLPAAIVGWVGLAVLLVACTLLSATTPFPGTAALLPVVGAALIIGAGCAAPSWGVGRVLSLAPMRAVGRLSYSLYLWHWPVLLLAPPLLGHELGLAGRLVAVLVSAGLAVLTLRFIEDPFRFAEPVRRSAARSLALGGGVTAAAVCVGVVLLVVVPVPVGRGPAAVTLTVVSAPPHAGGNVQEYDSEVARTFAQVEAAVAASADLRAVPSNLEPPIVSAAAEQPAMFVNSCMRDFFQVDQPECASGDTASPTTVTLVGDSNAAMWTPAFQWVAEQRHWRLETMVKAGCPLFDRPLTTPRLRREYTECAQWRDRIIARLGSEHPRLIVLGLSRTYGNQGFTSYDSAWMESLTRLVRELRGTGAQVLLLGPIPDPQSVVPMCLSGHLDDVAVCSPPTSAALNEQGIAAESAAARSVGGYYADLSPLFCTAERCPAIVGNTLVYMDRVHITYEYARLLGPVMGALADRALIEG